MGVNFFTKTTAANVWKSVIGVSAAGSKRGRGKGVGRAVVKDLNRGQEVGIGRRKLILPGLNSNIITNNKVVQIEDTGENPQFSDDINLMRQSMGVIVKRREMPLERGWSGRRPMGRSCGQPDDYNETSFDGFDSTVLMCRTINSMSGVMGRTRRAHVLVVTGNGKGLAGFATAIGTDVNGTIRKARNLASQSLVYVPLWENHTVMHDFFSKYYYTTVFVSRKPQGYGIVSHRIIKHICEAFGIKDIYVKAKGVTTNQINLTKAFFLGLMNQKSYQEMADEKGLHLVDVREENFEYPNILASPKGRVRTDSEIRASGENTNFTYYIYDGKIVQTQPKRINYFEGTPQWERHLDKLDYSKNREQTKLMLAAKYGNAKVKDIFPYFKTVADSFNKPIEDPNHETISK